MGVLILDGRTAVTAAAEATELCLTVVIPSLFPFFVLSSLLTVSGAGLLSPVLCRCGVPRGMEALCLTGLLGGFPVGAQMVGQACKDGRLDAFQGRTLLGICNQAGPAFLFGVVAPLFSSPAVGGALWGIQLLAALLTGALLVGRNGDAACRKAAPAPLSRQLPGWIRSLSYVCAWVILFRVVLAFLEKWGLRLLPEPVQLLAAGLVELTNGCMGLARCPSEVSRFLLAGVMLGCGGGCVLMQTYSLAAEAGLAMGPYLWEKAMQTGLQLTLCSAAAPFLFPQAGAPGQAAVRTAVYSLLPAIIFLIRKITVAKQPRLVYNKG